MLEFNVATLLQEPIGSTREYDIDEPLGKIDPELNPVEPVQGSVTFLRTHEGVLVQGELASVFELECNRCLTTFHMPLSIDIEEEFRSAIDLTTGASLPIAPEEEDTVIDEKHILNLTEVVRQLFLLAVPTTPVCMPNCKGLCPQCGTNLNEESCDCVIEMRDPRWSKLATLLDSTEEAPHSPN